VQRSAAAAGINILPGALFSPSGQYRQYIRISCGHPFETIAPAIRKLASLLAH
jgi:DNA-binding transcriptional MocR family regulator